MLVECGRLIRLFALWADNQRRNASTPMGGIARGCFVEQNDQQSVLGKSGIREQRCDVRLQPEIGLVQSAVVRVIFLIGDDE